MKWVHFCWKNIQMMGVGKPMKVFSRCLDDA